MEELTNTTVNNTAITAWITERVYWVFLGMMLLNVLQRRHQKQAQKKRVATLIIGITLFGILVVGQVIIQFGGADWMFYFAIVAAIGGIYYYREKAFPFRFRSPRDGRWHSFQEVLFDDEHGDGNADADPEGDGNADTDTGESRQE